MILLLFIIYILGGMLTLRLAQDGSKYAKYAVAVFALTMLLGLYTLYYLYSGSL